MFLEKNSEPVSRVLFLSLRAGACHLSTASVTAWSLSFHPPARTGRPLFFFAGLHELSTSGMHSTSVATGLVGSCPAFSPLPRLSLVWGRRGGSFLLHGQTLANLFPLGSGMPCAARTFLSCQNDTSDRPLQCFLGCKGSVIFRFSEEKTNKFVFIIMRKVYKLMLLIFKIKSQSYEYAIEFAHKYSYNCLF